MSQKSFLIIVCCAYAHTENVIEQLLLSQTFRYSDKRYAHTIFGKHGWQ